MGIHTGQKCFVCKQKFTEADDVVVCPECGTPYHRDCWQKEGACVNASLHQIGQSWVPEEIRDESKICPRCGTGNPKDAAHCQHCGVPFLMPEEEPSSLGEQIRETAQRLGIPENVQAMLPEQDIEGESLEDVANFVKVNPLYYLPKFLRFREGHRVSLNFACLLFPQYYLAYRKMWAAALILVGVLSLLHVPQTIVQIQTLLQEYLPMLQERAASQSILQTVQNILTKLDAYEALLYNAALVGNYVEIVICILLGIFGNHLYYRFVLRNVRKITAEDTTPACGAFVCGKRAVRTLG